MSRPHAEYRDSDSPDLFIDVLVRDEPDEEEDDEEEQDKKDESDEQQGDEYDDQNDGYSV